MSRPRSFRAERGDFVPGRTGPSAGRPECSPVPDIPTKQDGRVKPGHDDVMGLGTSLPQLHIWCIIDL
jgi:hypothetical protein